MPLQAFVDPDSTFLIQLQAANQIVQELVLLSSQEASEAAEPEVWEQGLLKLAQTLVHQMVSRLGVASARLWFFDPQEGCFRSVAHAGLLSPAHAQIERIYPDDSPMGRVVQQGLPLLSNNPDQEVWMPAPEWVRANGLRGFVAYPINRGEERLGALALLSRTPLEASFVEVVKFLCSYTASAIINAKLLERSRRQAVREALLNRITSTVHRFLQWDQIVSTALKELQHAFLSKGVKGLSRCCFYSINPDQETVQVTHEALSPGLAPSLGQVYRIQDFGSLCERLQEGQVVQIALHMQPAQEHLLPPQGLAAFQALQARSAVLIPLQAVGSAGAGLGEAGGRDPQTGRSDLAAAPGGMIGLLGVYLTTPHPWQPEEIDLLRSVAYQLAIALTRSSLFERAHRQAERLALLHSITAAIRSSLEPTTLFHAITQQIGAAFQADVCILALWQPEQEMLHPVGIYAPELTPAVRVSGTEPLLDAPLTGSLQKPWPEPGIPPELSETVQAKLRLAASLLTTLKEPVVVPDDLKPQRQGSGLLWVPLFASDQPQRQQEVLGGIALLRYPHGGSPWQPEDLELAEAVAEQAGIALQQAQLYEQTRISAQRESLLRQVAQRLSGTYDPHQVVEIALEGMAEVLQVDRCTFVAPRSGYGPSAQQPAAAPEPLAILQEYRRQPGIPSQVGQTLTPELSQLIWVSCYTHLDTLLIPDVQTFPLPLPTRQTLLQKGIRSLLCVPLVTDANQIAGVLCASIPPLATAGRKPPTADTAPEAAGFAPADRDLVEALADIAAVALQRASFYEQVRRQEATAAALQGLTEGREAESRRLAADLHDQTLADLGALSRQIQELAGDPTLSPAGQAQLRVMSVQLQETMAELRGIVEDLQPLAMRAFNLGPALRSLLERAAQRSPHPLLTRFDNRADGLLSRLSPACQSNIFRIVQEALNNIVKHAGARRIDITIQPKVQAGSGAEEPSVNPEAPYTHLELKIIDDGRGMPEFNGGIDPDQKPGHGHGLLNMRYRAELIGATITWRNRRLGSGTVVELQIPLPPPS
ncbi:GAF domain-containing protein/anti-sigma regulatory factor (Ser/Thr protein kinase) [Thermostichus sp. MS-CIW-19]|jgi:GAF domain-containing protein/anti-sigma regulatory factor (Ser/Thr protein kinase)|uniref:GAF domain-containing sensor histidine kinase n=1 Tax=unclassified Synechococcus TaxID=2626047 RepID=UPI000311DCBA|nr:MULTISPECIES: GAF domain-containing protein [unclassified Synechococcus]